MEVLFFVFFVVLKRKRRKFQIDYRSTWSRRANRILLLRIRRWQGRIISSSAYSTMRMIHRDWRTDSIGICRQGIKGNTMRFTARIRIDTGRLNVQKTKMSPCNWFFEGMTESILIRYSHKHSQFVRRSLQFTWCAGHWGPLRMVFTSILLF